MPPPVTFDKNDRSSDSLDMWATMRRFVPYLWPSGAPGLKARIVIAFAFVIASKLVQVYGAPFALQGAIDNMASGARELAWLVIALVVGYAAARFGTVLFDNLRNTVFEKVGQEATRRLTSNVFKHLHQLSLRFHLERRTGAVTKVVERGTKSIDTMLYFLLFNIAPTFLELTLVLTIFGTRFGAWLVIATLVMVAVYITFTRIVTDWRAKLREQMNEADTGAVAHAVDSLLNFETVKYFSAEERESARYDAAIRAYSNAATKSENSLAWLNVGQAVITNLMMGGGLAVVVWGWSTGRFSPGDVVLVSTLLTQLFRPLDLLGMVYRTIRQGIIDMKAMFDLVDTPAEIVDAPDAPELAVGAAHVRFENVRFGYEASREILHGVDIDVRPGPRWRWWGRRARANPLCRGSCSASTIRRAGASLSTGRTSPRCRSRASAARSASSRRTACCSTTRSATTSPTAGTARRRRRSRRRRAARPSTTSSCRCPMVMRPGWASVD
jgi:ATP-binding cassette subfamily B protein